MSPLQSNDCRDRFLLGINVDRAATAVLAKELEERSMKRHLVILMVLMLALSGGCNSWGKVAPKGTVRNAIVEADVKKNLIANGLTGLGVEVYEDGTAYLDGQVKSRSDRAKARHEALKVWGVKRVVNKITVQ
jgi:hypothetical protein